jgi:hypothetical protein
VLESRVIQVRQPSVNKSIDDKFIPIFGEEEKNIIKIK